MHGCTVTTSSMSGLVLTASLLRIQQVVSQGPEVGVGEGGRGDPPQWRNPGGVWGIVGFELRARAKKALSTAPSQAESEGTVFLGHSRDPTRPSHVYQAPSFLNKMSKVA